MTILTLTKEIRGLIIRGHPRSIKIRDVGEVKFLWKHFEERSWKPTRKNLTFQEAGNASVFHKTWGRDVEAVNFCGSGSTFKEGNERK